MTLLVAIDPGKNTGWAFFQNGALVQCKVSGWVEMFEHSDDFMRRFIQPSQLEVLGELPCVYSGPRPEDPNDLIVLAEQLGELLALYRARGCSVQTIHPRTWKGTVPKEHHQPRILSKLSPAELELVPRMPIARRYEHNAVDAVGLGLWKLGRMHG